jgi:hypothetical protein
MSTLHDHSSAELAAMTDADLDRVKQQVLDERRSIRQDRAPSDQPRLLAPTEGLLKRLKDEFQQRKRQF